jgi:hypothetical protein
MNNGEEGCQGRKEEGREEAVILPKAFRGCSVEHPIFLSAGSFQISKLLLSPTHSRAGS